jgi:K+-sensing histidine kinase KdpD
MKNLKRFARLLCSAGVAASIVVASRLPPNVHLATPSVLLLLAILVISSRWDFWEGAAATIVGDALLGFFFMPPQNEWRINSAQYWIVFVTFLIVGIATAYVAARAKRLNLETLSRSQELERLYAWTRVVSVGGHREDIVHRRQRFLHHRKRPPRQLHRYCLAGGIWEARSKSDGGSGKTGNNKLYL